MVWRQTPFTTLLFILASMLRNTANKQCGADIYSIYQMMLKGHTFKTFNTRPGSFDCGQACLGEVRCQSYNVVMLKGICELNNRTKEARPEDFVKNKDRYYMEKGSDRVPLGSIPELPGDSCKEIKASEGGDSGSAEGDGEYWIDPEGDGNPLKVYCDMKTDGGGWLRACNIVFDGYYNISLGTTYRAVASYHNKMCLAKNAMTELKTYIPFTQLRFHCNKQQGRTFHVATAPNSTGEAVVRYFSGLTDEQPEACGSFVRMDNDNSLLVGVCHKWAREHGVIEIGKWGHGRDQNRLYDHPAFAASLYHWLVQPGGPRWECDDWNDPASTGDFWKIYVR